MMERRPRILWYKARMPKAVTDGSSIATMMKTSVNISRAIANKAHVMKSRSTLTSLITRVITRPTLNRL